MTKKAHPQPPDAKSSEKLSGTAIAAIVGAVLTFLGVVIVAYIQFYLPPKISIEATQTAEAKLTVVALSATPSPSATSTSTPTCTPTPTPSVTPSPSNVPLPSDPKVSGPSVKYRILFKCPRNCPLGIVVTISTASEEEVIATMLVMSGTGQTISLPLGNYLYDITVIEPNLQPSCLASVIEPKGSFPVQQDAVVVP